MDEISFPFYEIKKKTIFSVNDFQVIFNTDLKTASNLDDGMCFSLLNVEVFDEMAIHRLVF